MATAIKFLLAVFGWRTAVAYEFPSFRGSYGANATEHYRFGEEVGTAFKGMILDRLTDTNAEATAAWLLADGKDVYQRLLAPVTSTYPNYVEELRGLAAGCNVSFEVIFAQNFGTELSYFKDSQAARVDHCSDYSMPPVALGHNEDSTVSDVDKVYLVDVTIDGGRFVAMTYAGELPGGAFGWNSNGVVVTENAAYPGWADADGYGRNFIGRSLLAADSAGDAVAKASALGIASGRNYQVASLDGSITNIEACSNQTAVTKVGAAPLFHANEFDTMDISEIVTNSTLHRTARAAQLPVPESVEDILAVLADREDIDGSGRWPIFHGGPEDVSGGACVATALFDFENRTVRVYRGPPTDAGSLVETRSLGF